MAKLTDARSLMWDYSHRLGWTAITQVDVLCAYIEVQGANDALADYLEQLARWEGAQEEEDAQMTKLNHLTDEQRQIIRDRAVKEISKMCSMTTTMDIYAVVGPHIEPYVDRLSVKDQLKVMSSNPNMLEEMRGFVSLDPDLQEWCETAAILAGLRAIDLIRRGAPSNIAELEVFSEQVSALWTSSLMATR